MSRGQDAGGVDEVLERERHAMQGSAAVAAIEFRLRAARSGPRRFGAYSDEGMELLIQRGDAREQRFGPLG